MFTGERNFGHLKLVCRKLFKWGQSRLLNESGSCLSVNLEPETRTLGCVPSEEQNKISLYTCYSQRLTASSLQKRPTLFPLMVQVTPKKEYLSLPEKHLRFSLSDISETVAGITYSKTLRLFSSGLLFLASVDFTLLSTSDCKEFGSIFRARNS